jgi:hypothetical protein
MLGEKEIRQLLERKGEGKNLDYKEAFNWQTGPPDDKTKIVKDMLVS